jgi:germination protein M
MKKSKKPIITIITLIIIVILAYFVYRNVSIEKQENNVNKYQDYTPQEEISDEQLRQTKVMLFFANNETGKLETEVKVIDANTLLQNPCKELVQLLLKGPQSSSLKRLIPEGTVLQDVTLENRCATINVSNEFLNYGDEENKLKIINSIVNTLTNLKDVESVKFLINGEQNEKLADTYVKITQKNPE